jgi:UDP-galactopyranose mutase
MNILVIGAGFSGAVAARQLAEKQSCKVEVWDERDHIGGNCHTERDSETGVMVHRYGPHIFNTDNERVWKYVQSFGDFRPFTNRVKAVTSKGVFSLPINLLTINQFFGKAFSPAEAEDFIRKLGDKSITEPANFEEQALKMLGTELYETFFEGYTVKQWGCHPKELPASILKRLPVRFNYDDNYYNKQFQGIPVEGYTDIIRRILDHPNIRVHLGRPFRPFGPHMNKEDKWQLIIYTGPIDAFFDYREGRLGYRTVTFEQIQTDASDYQGNAVVNYTDRSVPWTRIHEHKHFAPWEKHERTIAFREFSKETQAGDVPYYPKRLAADMAVLQRYREIAADPSTRVRFGTTVVFLGRLATYRYMDMETVIAEALEFTDKLRTSFSESLVISAFPNIKP